MSADRRAVRPWPRLRTPARAGALAFAAAMLVAALLKAVHPHAAVHALVWTQAPHAVRLACVIASVAVESAVAAAILLGVLPRIAMTAGAVMGVSLLGLHVVQRWWLGVEDCGCFGEVAVPAALVVLLLAAGSAACWFARPASGAEAGRAGLPRIACVVVAAAVLASLPAGEVGATGRVPATTRLVEELGLGRGTAAVIVVGSPSCGHCRRVLARLASEPAGGERRLVLVTRSSDGPVTAGGGRVAHRVVEDDLWWRLVTTEPPVVLHVTADGRVREASGPPAYDAGREGRGRRSEGSVR